MAYLIPLVVLFALFWLFVLLPQRRRQRDHVAMQDTVAVGDEVVTAGGLHGDVVGIDDAVLRLEVAPDVVVRVDRRAVAARVAPTAPEPAEEAPVEIPSAADDNPG